VVLKKRERYKKVFLNFDPDKVARISDAKLERALTDPGLIRNRLKIYSVRSNEKALKTVQSEFGSFASFIWSFTDGVPVQNHWKNSSQVPAKTTISTAMSKDLKQRGFKFVGETICYAYMQGIGMVNDHVTSCYRHKDVKKMKIKEIL